eukprot:superscaffoldBa00001190_g9425
METGGKPRLLLGRNDHFQQQSPRIRETCHIVPVTTNDYQCIWAGCQCAGVGTAGGVEEMVEVGAARSKETEICLCTGDTLPPEAHTMSSGYGNISVRKTCKEHGWATAGVLWHVGITGRARSLT